MKAIHSLPILIIFLLSGCGSTETISYESSEITASGEFLFEGPNTLQGPFSISIVDIANANSLNAENITAVIPSGLTVMLPADSIQSDIESLLVQVVSDELPLTTIATISPLKPGKSQSLSVNEELDLLPYTKDPTSTLVVDTNLTTDKDDLSVKVKMTLTINYK